MSRDLGTYHLRVVLRTGKGWIERLDTARRYMRAHAGVSPLGATPIPATWEHEDDLIDTILYQYMAGNYSCACNRELNLARAEGRELPPDTGVCLGELPEYELGSLTLIRPDGTERELYTESPVP